VSEEIENVGAKAFDDETDLKNEDFIFVYWTESSFICMLEKEGFLFKSAAAEVNSQGDQ
jgi:hypothetical protein